MTPSKYQQAIYDAHARADRTIAVNAVAGGGKSFTLRESLSLRDDPALVLAFNKHTADHLRPLVPSHVAVRTNHSHGLSALSRAATGPRPRVDENKYLTIVRETLRKDDPSLWQRLLYSREWDCIADLLKLVDWARLTCVDDTDPALTMALATEAGLMCPEPFADMLPLLLWKGAKAAEDGGIIDFGDMLHLPLRWNLDLDTYPMVFVDELQDLNAAQLQLMLRSRGPGCTGVMCGDPNQSIFQFAWAGGEVWDNALSATQAHEMPLSICYRCPTSHLDLARELVPRIEARPDAPPGVVRVVDPDTWAETATPAPGDMILCRKTAPLIEACLALLRRKVPARVRGRDIGSDIAGTLRAAGRHDIDALEADLDAYTTERARQLIAQQAPSSQLSLLMDRVASARAAYHGLYPCESLGELIAKVQQVFSDNGGGVVLSTVHRAKGLEADNVTILHPEMLTTDTQEEANVKYVALTRARQTLTLVHDDERFNDGPTP